MMGSFSGTCEITEVKDEPDSPQNYKRFQQSLAHEKDPKLPMLKLGSDCSLEDDINKLFDAIKSKSSPSNLQSLQQARVSSRRNTSKQPVGVGVPRSPQIGFSGPVSIKQALRGLCISQASEVAAMKRLSRPANSPRISEASKIIGSYVPIVLETGESSGSASEVKMEGGVEISLVPEQGPPRAYGKSSEVNPYNGSPCSSSQLPSVEVVKEMEFALAKNDNIPATKAVASPTLKTESVSKKQTVNGDCILKPHLEKMREPEKVSSSTAVTSEILKSKEVPNQTLVFEILQEEDDSDGSITCDPTVPPSIQTRNKASASKIKRKGKSPTVLSSSNANKSSGKGSKLTKKAQVFIKPVRRNKAALRKNLKQDSTSVVSTSNPKKDISTTSDPSTGQLLCHRCRCALSNNGNEFGEKSSSQPNCESSSTEISSGALNSGSNNYNKALAVIEKAVKSIKTKEKGNFSHSSKSSICDYSASSSISEESIISGSSCGNRPHMSKDLRWEAIRHIRKEHGFLGLGHFNLLKKLGSGDIGTVYLAELIGTNCLFAIKVMDNEFLARRKKMPRAQTEKEILRMLDHPFLPTLYGQFTSNNLSCLVMEYCPGGDLHVLRQKQPGRYFPEQAARFYVAEVLLALEYLHMLGVIYRDLKPENILVREDGHIMLTDFDLSLRCSVSPTLLKSPLCNTEPPRVSGPCTGSNCIDPFCVDPSCKVSCFSPKLLPNAAKARKLKADQAARARSLPQLVAEPTDARSNSFVGTHEYLAPEIIKGEGHGSAVDWWTFGVFLYELLYGRTPFKGAGNDETLANVVLQNLKFPESPLVSFQARELIQGLLAKEPENRLGTEKGAAEIKQHPFFDGLNWALIRCGVPPQLPELCDMDIVRVALQEKGRKYLEYRDAGEHLEFELF